MKPNRSRCHWTDAEYGLVLAWRRVGLTIKEIARIARRTPCGVAWALETMRRAGYYTERGMLP